MNLMRVDMTRQTVTAEPAPESFKALGGRGLIAEILTDLFNADSLTDTAAAVSADAVVCCQSVSQYVHSPHLT